MSLAPVGMCCIALVLGLLGCAKDQVVAATQLLVSVDSDLEAGTQLARVRIQVRDARGEIGTQQLFALRASGDERGGVAAGGRSVSLPFSFGIERGQAQRLELWLLGYAPDADEPLLERKLEVEFREHETRRVALFLDARCAGSACADDETCAPASVRCEPIPEWSEPADGGGIEPDGGVEPAADGGDICQPRCEGKRCGPDGCGGECGTCPNGEKCSAGRCSCTPDCNGKACGDDGCGGECAPGCNAQTGSCVDGACKGSCEALVTACNCATAPTGAQPGSQRSEPLCASGYCVFAVCPDTTGNGSNLCIDPNTGNAIGYQWGEVCGC